MKCKKMLMDNYRRRGCTRNASRDGYCKQHHPDSVKKREEKRELEWKMKRENSTGARLGRANDKIEKYESYIEQMKMVANDTSYSVSKFIEDYAYMLEDDNES